MAESRYQLSLWSAVIINLNIIIGSGVFINTAELASRAGVLGGLCYVLVGLLLLPLIVSFAQLLRIYPGGGFYSFASQSISPFVGAMSTWCYFTTKLSSATLIIHIFVSLLQQMFPVLAAVNTFALNVLVLLLIVTLNMLNVQTGSSIQRWLMIFKLAPLISVILLGLYGVDFSGLTVADYAWTGLPLAMPLVLHALLGFETACSISRNIKNPEVNGPRSVLISYAIVILLYVLYQLFFYGVVGSDLALQGSYKTAFALFFSTLGLSAHAQQVCVNGVYLCIAASALSAGFGIIYANMWNVYTLAELQHIAGSSYLARFNRFNIPMLCVFIQGLISLCLMIIIQGQQTVFQQLSALGATVTYTTSVVGLLSVLKQQRQSLLVPFLALGNCMILLSASMYTLYWTQNCKPVIVFLSLMFLGVILYKKED